MKTYLPTKVVINQSILTTFPLSIKLSSPKVYLKKILFFIFFFSFTVINIYYELRIL